MISLTYSSSVQAAIAETSTQADWCSAIADTIGSDYKLIGRQDGTPKVTISYTGAMPIQSYKVVLGNTYTTLSMIAGTKELLVWRIESSDGEDWVEFQAPLDMTADPDPNKGLVMAPSVTLSPPPDWPPGTELSWFGVSSSYNIDAGSSYSMATHVSYDGGGELTYSSIGTSLSGTGISLNSSTGVLAVSGEAEAGTVSGIQLRVTDGVETADSPTFSVVKQVTSLSLNIPNLTVYRDDRVNLLNYVTYSGNKNNLTFSEVTSKLTVFQYIQNLTSTKRLWIAANSPESVITGITISVTDGEHTAQSTFNLTTAVNDDVLWWDGLTSTLARPRTGSLDLSDHVVYHAEGTLTYSSIGASLPAGCSLNAATGRITITSATVATTSGLQFRVTDGTFTEDSPVFALEIVDEVLLLKDNFTWEGAFKVPLLSGTGEDVETFNYGGTLGGIDPAGNSGNGSIYMYGKATDAHLAEITIPTPSSNTSDISALPRASIIQPMADATEGTFYDLPLTRMAGAYIDGSDLIMTAYQWYGETRDGPTHWLRSKNLSTTGSPGGPKVCLISNYVDDNIGWLAPGSPWTTRAVGGMMCAVPPAWQSALGGTLLCGIAGMSVVSSTTNGPTAFSLTKAELANTNPKINGLVAYPLSSTESEVLAKQMNVVHQGGDWLASGSRFWSYTSHVRGMIFPEGTDSIVFFGDTGVGIYWYGQGNPTGPAPDNEYPWGYTLEYESQGGHSNPGVWQAWAYRAADLAEVHAGNKLHYQITPYAVWNIDLPAYDRTPELPYVRKFTVGGAAYNPNNGKLYISVEMIEGSRPIVHVIDVDF